MVDSTFDYSGYYLIVLASFTVETNQYAVVSKMLQDCWSKHIVNVNVLVTQAINSDAIIMYTYFPFTQSVCEQAFPVAVRHFANNKFDNSSQLFADKAKNLHKCKIIVSSGENLPYSIFAVNENGQQVINGVDGRILGCLSRRMNFTPHIRHIERRYNSSEYVLNSVSKYVLKRQMMIAI